MMMATHAPYFHPLGGHGVHGCSTCALHGIVAAPCDKAELTWRTRGVYLPQAICLALRCEGPNGSGATISAAPTTLWSWVCTAGERAVCDAVNRGAGADCRQHSNKRSLESMQWWWTFTTLQPPTALVCFDRSCLMQQGLTALVEHNLISGVRGVTTNRKTRGGGGRL